LTILIFGSEGFIGSHCINIFKNKGYEVTGADIYEQPSRNYNYRKVTHLSPNFEELFTELKFDVVINAAGSGNVPYSVTHPAADFEANCIDVFKILDCLRRNQPTAKYIHLSSAAVYGNPVNLPITEDSRMSPLSPYGWHKYLSEKICKEFATLYHMQIGILRLFSVYGPGLKKQFFWDLHNKIRKINKGEVIELFGTGNESRDYIHVEDVVRAIEIIADRGELDGTAYNVASGKETSIKHAANSFFRLYGSASDFRFNGHIREGDPLNWRADINRISKLGFTVNIDVEDGLKGVVSWLQSVIL
jgi:UDP-glucose 4-epimerase